MLALYGVAVIVNATVLQQMNGWYAATDYPRAVIRCVGMLLLAWGLLKGARWAWWVAVLLSSFWMLASVGALVAFGAVQRAGTANPFGPGFVVFAVVSGTALAAAVVLLLLPESRAALLRPRA